MDDTKSNTTGSASRRSEEEMAWDAEFANMEEPKEGGVKGTLESVATMLVKLPAALVQLPMAILPEETQKHARAAVLESFLALRSLLSAVGDGIEGAFSEAGDKKGTVRGPQGTWGSGRYSPSQGKAQRIEIQDEVSESGGGDGSGTRITIDDLGDAGDENDETKEGRGLRADIDY
jgi:hypothetical protein